MKAYKVFNENWICKDYDFKDENGNVIGTIHEIKEELELCKIGFHFCRKLSNCFNYYGFDPTNKIAEIEILGDYIGDKNDKECTNKFKIIKELTWHEVLDLCNSGNRNSGNSNSGDSNSGDRNSGNSNSGNSNSGNWNSGDWNSGNSNSGDSNSGDSNSGDSNSGNWNSGDRNSGDWNSGNWNSGYLNTIEPEQIYIFNKLSENKAINFPDFFYFSLTQWVAYDIATQEEKEKYKKEIEVCGGFLKKLEYKEAWKISWNKASIEDKKKVFDIPNFDNKLFFEISGIDVLKELEEIEEKK